MSYTQKYENLTDEFASTEWNDGWGDIDTNNQNYIDWITYDIGQTPEYKDCVFDYAREENNSATIPQENIFANENQNDIDILNESSQCDYNNIISEKNNNMPQLSKILLEEENISAEDPSDLYNTSFLEEELEKQTKQIQKEIKELNKQKLKLENEERKLLELVGPNDNMRNKYKSNISYDNQLLPIDRVNNINYHYQTEKWDEKMNRNCTIEIRPHFININNKNEKTINISDNHSIDITNML